MGQQKNQSASGDVDGTVHVRFRIQAVTLLGALGAVCAFIVLRWPQVEPVINSPFGVVMAMVGFLLSGGGMVHWLVAVPAIRRAASAEGVIKTLRLERDEFHNTISDMKAMIASLQTEVRHLKEYVERLEQTPQPARKSTRKPAAKKST
jgi:hypothetical protein